MKENNPKTKHNADLTKALEKISELEDKIRAMEESQTMREDLFSIEILKGAPYPIHIKDLNGKYIYTNTAFDSLLGLKQGDCFGKTAHDLFSDDLADVFCFNDQHLISTGSHLEFCVTVLFHNEKHAFQIKKFLLKNAQGKTGGICGIGLDLTEHMNAERALRLNESRLEALHTLARMSAATLQELTDFALEKAISLTESKIGYLAFMDEDEKVLTMHSWSKTAMDECMVHNKKMRYSIATTGLWGEAVRQRKPIITNDYSAFSPYKKGLPTGHLRIKRHMNIPVFEGNKIVAVAGVGNKNSEYNESDVRQLNLHMSGMWGILRKWKDADEQRILRDNLSDIFNSMPSQLIAIDNNCIVTQWNTETEKRTKIAKETALKQPINEVLPHLESVMPSVLFALSNKKNQTISKRSRIVDGEICYEDIIIYPLVTEGISGAVIRLDDITERVKMEEVMMQSEKMMSIGGIAAGMAHEINTPLAGIIASCQNIKRRLFSDMASNEKAAAEIGISLEHLHSYMDHRKIPTKLNTILDLSNRAKAIVSNMLSFSRVSGGKRKKHDLAKLLDEMINLATSDYGSKTNSDRKKIKIIRNYDKNIPLVLCDGNEIQQVFLNILNNGAQAMAEKDPNFRQACFEIRISKSEQRVKIEIKDNGPGITAQIKKQIFKPFFTTKDENTGTGLGLSVSKFIITERHCGKMKVESELGSWTKFTIELPTSSCKM